MVQQLVASLQSYRTLRVPLQKNCFEIDMFFCRALISKYEIINTTSNYVNYLSYTIIVTCQPTVKTHFEDFSTALSSNSTVIPKGKTCIYTSPYCLETAHLSQQKLPVSDLLTFVSIATSCSIVYRVSIVHDDSGG